MRRHILFLGVLFALLSGQFSLAGAAEPAERPVSVVEGGQKDTGTSGATEKAKPSVAATVNGAAISTDELDAALVVAARRKFYHGKIDPAKVDEFRRTVLDDLIAEHLLLRETEARNILPDTADVESKIAAMEERYKDSAEWKAQRDQTLPAMRERMLLNSRKGQLEKKIREVPPPDDVALNRFYEQNKDLFTEPVRDRVAVILLKVDPSSTRVVWEEAAAEAARLHEKLRAGADFAELAKLHSSDKSAAEGGDMGYLHVGRLGAEAREAVEKLDVGEVTPPVQLLEGYALFRLLDRQPSRVHPLSEVTQRATDLYVRNTGEKNWTAFQAKLRSDAKIWINPEVVAVSAGR
ncbi:MAG: peptidylprolyl isomerase [Alphaproteobacteria bacterium]